MLDFFAGAVTGTGVTCLMYGVYRLGQWSMRPKPVVKRSRMAKPVVKAVAKVVEQSPEEMRKELTRQLVLGKKGDPTKVEYLNKMLQLKAV